MFPKKTVRDIDVDGKKVLVRVDFNVPLEGGRVADDTRIQAALPTIRYLMERNACIILLSHLGRPKGRPDPGLKLDPVAERLGELLDVQVRKVDSVVGEEVQGAVDNVCPGGILLLENVRFDPREKANDKGFSRQLAALGEIFVNDAFGAAHRAHASTAGIAGYLPSVAGLLLEKEMRTLSELLENPQRPFVAILGGNKVSDKIGVIDKFLETVDTLLTGGGMCFTFLKAKGLEIGASLFQDEELDHSREMMEKAKQRGVPLELPFDVVVAPEISAEAPAGVVDVEEMPKDQMGLDIGPRTADAYSSSIAGARTVFWNGPMGVFEIDKFSNGTGKVARAVAACDGLSIVGGGDSDAALRKFGLEEKIGFISTGGGASLKVLEGGRLPGVEALSDADD